MVPCQSLSKGGEETGCGVWLGPNHGWCYSSCNNKLHFPSCPLTAVQQGVVAMTARQSPHLARFTLREDHGRWTKTKQWKGCSLKTAQQESAV